MTEILVKKLGNEDEEEDSFKTFYDLFKKDKWPIYAFFLYSSVNRNFIRYIRDHYLNVLEMANDNCLVFLTEELSEVYLMLVKKRYKELVEGNDKLRSKFLFKELSTETPTNDSSRDELDYLDMRRLLLLHDHLPYTEKKKPLLVKSKENKISKLQPNIYEIARKLDLSITNLPCIVFFKNVNEKKFLIYNFGFVSNIHNL